MLYKDYLHNEMIEISKFDDTIIIGQWVGKDVGGTYMWSTFVDLDHNKLFEMPVNESFQMQFGTGIALTGKFCCNVFPRQNFLLHGLGDLVNLSDKVRHLSLNEDKMRMAIRVGMGTTKPIFPGIQHALCAEDHIEKMLINTEVIRLTNKTKIVDEYLKSYYRTDGKITMLVEYGDMYNE